MFVISDRELELLSGGGLSNEDRAVYLLSLRPVARNGKAVLDRDVIAEQMAVRDHRGPGSISDDELQDILFGLLGQGLIERRKGAEGLFQDGETVFLPAAERSRKIWLCR